MRAWISLHFLSFDFSNIYGCHTTAFILKIVAVIPFQLGTCWQFTWIWNIIMGDEMQTNQRNKCKCTNANDTIEQILFTCSNKCNQMDSTEPFKWSTIKEKNNEITATEIFSIFQWTMRMKWVSERMGRFFFFCIQYRQQVEDIYLFCIFVCSSSSGRIVALFSIVSIECFHNFGSSGSRVLRLCNLHPLWVSLCMRKIVANSSGKHRIRK